MHFVLCLAIPARFFGKAFAPAAARYSWEVAANNGGITPGNNAAEPCRCDDDADIFGREGAAGHGNRVTRLFHG